MRLSSAIPSSARLAAARPSPARPSSARSSSAGPPSERLFLARPSAAIRLPRSPFLYPPKGDFFADPRPVAQNGPFLCVVWPQNIIAVTCLRTVRVHGTFGVCLPSFGHKSTHNMTTGSRSKKVVGPFGGRCRPMPSWSQSQCTLFWSSWWCLPSPV